MMARKVTEGDVFWGDFDVDILVMLGELKKGKSTIFTLYYSFHAIFDKKSKCYGTPAFYYDYIP